MCYIPLERMRYEIRFKASAWRLLRKLDREARGRIIAAIWALGDNPRPPGSRKLTATEDFYRIRVGRYRVIYEVRDDDLVVLVIKLGHRRDVYRKL